MTALSATATQQALSAAEMIQTTSAGWWETITAALSATAISTGAVTGTYCLGGLVGYNDGTISNCYLDRRCHRQNGSSYIGGLVG